MVLVGWRCFCRGLSGVLFVGNGDDDAGGAKESVVVFPAAAHLADDGVVGCAGGCCLAANGFVEVGVEGRAFSFYGCEAVVLEDVGELKHGHVDAAGDGGGVFGRCCGLDAEVEVVEGGDDVLGEVFVGVAANFVFFAGGAFFEVVHFSGEAEEFFLEFVGTLGECEELGVVVGGDVEYGGDGWGGVVGWWCVRLLRLWGLFCAHKDFFEEIFQRRILQQSGVVRKSVASEAVWAVGWSLARGIASGHDESAIDDECLAGDVGGGR